MKIYFKILVLLLLLGLFNILIFSAYAESLSENSYIVIDFKSKTVLMEKNKSARVFPASTTKILTCAIALEHLNLDDKVTVTKEMLKEVPSGSSTMKLALGDIVTVKDLLYGLMLPSGNDAAIVIAHLVSSDTEKFVQLMNEKLKEIGCLNTHFSNPHGFHDKNHYTTAEDMAKILMYALKNNTFIEIISTDKYTLKANNAVLYDRNYASTNSLITNTKYHIYGKSGYTEEAGNVFAAYTEYEDKQIISVLLDGDKNYYNNTYRFKDTLRILNYIFDNYSLQTIIPKESIKLKLIDKSQKCEYIYSNTKDIPLFVNSENVKIDYDIKNSYAKIGINITGTKYYIKDMEISLDEISKNNNLTFGITKQHIKLIILICIDSIAIFLLFITILNSIYIKKTKKKKIKRTIYNSNLYR